MLRSLDVSFNQIASPRALLALRPCVKLETIALNDNPVSLLGKSRRKMKKRKNGKEKKTNSIQLPLMTTLSRS